VRDDPSVVALVTRAAGSDEGAWHELVDRYAPLVWSICVRYQLSGADIEDVGQTVWLGLVEQLASEKLREPAALPGWLATTTQRECLRVLRVRGKYEVFGTDPEDGGLPREADATGIDATVIEEEILLAERNALLRAALAELPEADQRLIGLLLRDPPLSYAEIGSMLGMPPGSIGPTRQRCLRRLGRSRLLAGLSDLAPPPVAGAASAPRAHGGPPAAPGTGDTGSSQAGPSQLGPPQSGTSQPETSRLGESRSRAAQPGTSRPGGVAAKGSTDGAVTYGAVADAVVADAVVADAVVADGVVRHGHGSRPGHRQGRQAT
jgi:RNA polymerase sigma factor (sigma-70 family)